MTDNQKHAARLRAESKNYVQGETKAALLAGAIALEGQGQGRWRLMRHFGQSYLIPFERAKQWIDWCENNRETGEYTAIVPEWAKPVPENVVITGVELP